MERVAVLVLLDGGLDVIGDEGGEDPEAPDGGDPEPDNPPENYGEC